MVRKISERYILKVDTEKLIGNYELTYGQCPSPLYIYWSKQQCLLC